MGLFSRKKQSPSEKRALERQKALASFFAGDGSQIRNPTNMAEGLQALLEARTPRQKVPALITLGSIVQSVHDEAKIKSFWDRNMGAFTAEMSKLDLKSAFGAYKTLVKMLEGYGDELVTSGIYINNSGLLELNLENVIANDSEIRASLGRSMRSKGFTEPEKIFSDSVSEAELILHGLERTKVMSLPGEYYRAIVSLGREVIGIGTPVPLDGKYYVISDLALGKISRSGGVEYYDLAEGFRRLNNALNDLLRPEKRMEAQISSLKAEGDKVANVYEMAFRAYHAITTGSDIDSSVEHDMKSLGQLWSRN